MRLSAEGAAFLTAARWLVASHGRAFGAFSIVNRRLVIGKSHHLLGPELPVLLRHMNDLDSSVVVEMHVATSHEVLQAFDTAQFPEAAGLVDLASRCGWPRRRHPADYGLQQPIRLIVPG